MPKVVFVDHEPTWWDNLKGFFGGYKAVNMDSPEAEQYRIPADAPKMSDDTIEVLNQLSGEDDELEYLDQSSHEISTDDLNMSRDDGFLDPMMKDINLPKEKEDPEKATVATAVAVAKKVGFFEGIWKGIKGWFKGIFSGSSANAPKADPVSEAKPEVESPEDIKARLDEKMDNYDNTKIEKRKALSPAERLSEDKQILQDRLNALGDDVNPMFKEQVEDLIKNENADPKVVNFLAFSEESSFETLNEHMQDYMRVALEAGQEVSNTINFFVNNSMEKYGNPQYQEENSSLEMQENEPDAEYSLKKGAIDI